ncbi:uncharacterized protein ACOB8E_009780 [Sarcophilus harrisii]
MVIGCGCCTCDSFLQPQLLSLCGGTLLSPRGPPRPPAFTPNPVSRRRHGLFKGEEGTAGNHPSARFPGGKRRERAQSDGAERSWAGGGPLTLRLAPTLRAHTMVWLLAVVAGRGAAGLRLRLGRLLVSPLGAAAPRPRASRSRSGLARGTLREAFSEPGAAGAALAAAAAAPRPPGETLACPRRAGPLRSLPPQKSVCAPGPSPSLRRLRRGLHIPAPRFPLPRPSLLRDARERQHLVLPCIRCLGTEPRKGKKEVSMYYWFPQHPREDPKKTEKALPDASTGDESKQSKHQQLRKVFKEYGPVAVCLHIGISLISLGIFYLVVSSGVDITSFLYKLGFAESLYNSKVVAGTSTFVMAYAVHKLFAPVRISITLFSLPLVVRYFRKMGFFKAPGSKP